MNNLSVGDEFVLYIHDEYQCTMTAMVVKDILSNQQPHFLPAIVYHGNQPHDNFLMDLFDTHLEAMPNEAYKVLMDVAKESSAAYKVTLDDDIIAIEHIPLPDWKFNHD